MVVNNVLLICCLGFDAALTCGPVDTVFLRGEDVELSCTTDQIEPVNWQHNKNKLILVGGDVRNILGRKYAVRRDGGYNVLTVRNVSMLDSGKYTCIDNNGVGERSASADLIVLGKLVYSENCKIFDNFLITLLFVRIVNKLMPLITNCDTLILTFLITFVIKV